MKISIAKTVNLMTDEVFVNLNLAQLHLFDGLFLHFLAVPMLRFNNEININ